MILLGVTCVGVTGVAGVLVLGVTPRCFCSWQTLFVTDFLGVTVLDVTGLLGVTVLDVTGLLGVTILDVTGLRGVPILDVTGLRGVTILDVTGMTGVIYAVGVTDVLAVVAVGVTDVLAVVAVGVTVPGAIPTTSSKESPCSVGQRSVWLTGCVRGKRCLGSVIRPSVLSFLD